MLCSHVDIFCDGEDSIFSGASFVALKRDLIAAYLTAPSISNGSEVQAVLDAFRDSFFKRSYGQLGGIQFQQIKQIFLDTALTNYREIHLIQQVFPHSTIINVVRDPMDTLLSCFRYQYHNIDSEWALNGVDLLDEYVGYLKTMSFYRKQYPDSILLINFEALVRDKKSLIRLVLEHIGARWDVKNIFSVMPYNDSVLYSFSTKSFVCVKSELQRHGIGAWKNYSEEISHIRQSILKSLSILQESKTILPFDDSMNWAISEDFDYNQQSSPGYFLPSNLKLFRNLSIDRKYGLPFIISNITTALLVPDFLIAPRGISVLYRYGGPMKTLRPLGTRLAFKTGTVRLVQQREGLLLHILRLHAPFRISSVDRKRQISKRRSLPVADKDKRILSLQDRSVVRGVHLQAVLLEMRHLLGLQAEIPYNQSISVEDLVAYGYCSLTSNMQNRYEKAAEVFKELQAHFKTTKQQKGSNMCLVDVGYVLAKIGQSNIVSTNITAFKMPTESKLHWGASDIAEAVNALVSRGAFEEASKIIAEALSRDIHDHAALCILKIQIAWILLKLGSFDAALKHARAVENEFPSLLQAHVLKAEILIAMGDPKRAFDELHQSMLHPDPPISDPYVEEHTVLISLSRISPSWMELIFSSLVPAILEKIGANCSIAQSADHTLSFVESLISLDFIMRHLRWLCDRSQLLQPEHVAILSVADTSQDLNIKVLSALTVHQLVLGRSSMSLMYISRLIELQPDHDSILIAMARNKIHHPDNFLLAVDILDHALLMHKHVKCNAWFFREILYFWAAHLDVHISSTRIYEELSRKVRVGAIATAGIEICDLSLVSTWNTTALRFLQDYNSKRASKTRDISDKKSATKGLLNYTLELTKFIPYTANASIFTDRELIAMGLAAIAISKLQLRCSSSVFVGSKIDPGAESVLNDMDCKTKNFFTVSDLLDSSVKWLQFIDIMEPTLNRNENVLNVLVDIPTRFFEGKYKHTAFVLFQAGVIEKAKDLFHQVTEFQMRDFLGFIHAATNVEELCAVAGFEIAGLVETTVHSISKKDTMLPGVSLLISTKSGLKQIAYKISSSPRRTALYYMELEFIAERMAVAFSNDVHSEEILLLALDFFFYFIHLSPFQSGNQKIGYSILTGILLMAGETILYPIEELAFSMHLEWEALLCSHPTKFREAVASIFSFKTFIIDDTTTTARSIDFDYHMIDTPRKILNFLNSE